MTTMRIPPDTINHGDMPQGEFQMFADKWPYKDFRELNDAGINGEGILVAIGDTGIANHSCFRDLKIVDRKNYVSGGSNVTDYNGHGTHCASLIGGINFGAANKCSLIVNQVLSAKGSGSNTGINQAVVDSAKAGALFYSGSYGSSAGSESNEDRQSIEAAYDAGLSLYIVAAGNAGFNGVNSIGPPGSYEWEQGSKYGVLTVGALNEAGQVSGFSSGGKAIDVAAPGEKIPGASHNGEKEVQMSGTSMATPIVTGLIALIAQTLLRIGHALPMGFSEWMNFFLKNGFFKDLGTPGFDHRTGHGRLDIPKIFAWLRNPVGIMLLLSLFCSSAFAQITAMQNSEEVYLSAKKAKVYDNGDGVVIVAEDVDLKPKYGRQIKIDTFTDYSIFATDQNKVGFNPVRLTSLEKDLWLLIGEPDQKFMVIVFGRNKDGFQDTKWSEVVIGGPKKPTEPPVVQPPVVQPPSDVFNWSKAAKDLALQIDDKITAKKLGEGYVSVAATLTTIDLNEAMRKVSNVRGDILLMRIGPSRDKNWNVFLIEMEKAIIAAKFKTSSDYAKAIEAIGKGLIEASK